MPAPKPVVIGRLYVPFVEELCVATLPPESEPVAAPVAWSVVSVMLRSYCDSDCQVVVRRIVEPSSAVVVSVCEPVSSAVGAAVSGGGVVAVVVVGDEGVARRAPVVDRRTAGRRRDGLDVVGEGVRLLIAQAGCWSPAPVRR